jgi:tetratricopeptide (TPR) repeat protein
MRMACLEQDLWQVGELVGIFSAADASVIEIAPRAVAALPAPEQCSEVVRMLAMPPLPGDRDARARVEAIRREIASVKALRTAGRYIAALDVAQRAIEATRAVSYRPVQAEALLALGEVQVFTGQYDGAAQSLYAALGPAETAMHHEVAADAWIRLVFVEYLRARPDLGELWIPRAAAALERLGGDPTREARLDRGMSGLAKLRGQLGEAVRLVRASIQELERVRPLDHIELGTAYQNLAATLGDAEQFEPALVAARRALAEDREGLPADHPQVARAIMTEGAALADLGRNDEAAARLGQALALLERVLGSDHANVGDALAALAAVAIEQHDYARAQDYNERAFRIRTRTLPPRHPYLITTLNNFGDLSRAQGAFPRAIGYYEQAITAGDSLPAPRRAYALVGIGQSHLGLGHARAAIAPLTQALALLADGSDKLLRSQAQFAMARALSTIGREQPRALALARDARDTLQQSEHPRARTELQAVSAWLATHGASGKIGAR